MVKVESWGSPAVGTKKPASCETRVVKRRKYEDTYLRGEGVAFGAGDGHFAVGAGFFAVVAYCDGAECDPGSGGGDDRGAEAEGESRGCDEGGDEEDGGEFHFGWD